VNSVYSYGKCMCVFGNDISVSVFVLQKPDFVFKQLRKSVIHLVFLSHGIWVVIGLHENITLSLYFRKGVPSKGIIIWGSKWLKISELTHSTSVY